MYTLGLILVFLIFCLITIQILKYSGLNHIPGPTTIELLKFFLYSHSNNSVYNYIISLPRKYGPVVKVWAKPLRPALLVSDRRYFEHILLSKEHINRPPIYDLFSGICGKGFVGLKDASVWRRERKMLSHAFSKKATINNSKKMLYYSEKLVDFLSSRENEVVDVQPVVERYTLPIVIDYLTGEDVSSEERVITDFIKALEKYQKIYLQRAYSLYKFYDVIFQFTSSFKTWSECGAIVHNIMKKIVQKQDAIRTNLDRQDCLDLLRLNEFTDDSLLGHLKTFVLAGYETTAVVIGLALYELSKRTDIQEKLYKEYLSVVGNGTKEINANSMHDMKYTESVIKETLRMYPAAPIIQRRLKSSVTIGDVTIPSGTDIMFSITSLHMSAEYFEDPLKFDPERFLPENLNKIPPYAFAPFLHGPRDCIGRNLAMMEMMFMVSYIIGHLTIHPSNPDHKLELYSEMSLKSKTGVPLVFKTRQNSH